MAWPYHFYMDLPEADKAARRDALNLHGLIAHLSPLVLSLLYFLYSRGSSALSTGQPKKGAYDRVPDSPALKSQRLSNSGATASRFMKLKWWLSDPVILGGQPKGQRDQFVFGFGWAVWLLILCFSGTGDDYLHLTKRFGIVAASQIPIQYLLSLKALNPFAAIFRTSHERINRFHRVLGRVIYLFLWAHVILYFNFFIQNGLLQKRLSAPVVIFGILAMNCLHVLMITAAPPVRQWSYRVFFVTHLIVVFVLPALLFLHAGPARPYIAEAILVFIVDVAVRKATTAKSMASLESIPGTNLVKVSVSVPMQKLNKLRESPGSHVYLNVPPSPPGAKSQLPPIFKFLHNPFTVAGIDEKTGDAILVARERGGPMTKQLGQFASASSQGKKILLNVEGPYGCVGKHLSNISGTDIDRILLVAGGIGATFAMPVYKSLLQDNPSAKVQLAWAVRAAGEATWAVGRTPGKSVLEDENIHIFLTGDILDGAAQTAANGSVEMTTLNGNKENKKTSQPNHRRPDLKKLVDDLFKAGKEERVAVLVCGPLEMSVELRGHVTPWVMKGRQVFWHSEVFGM